MFYAHSSVGRPETDWQRLDVHCRAVAALARAFGARFGIAEAAAAAGLLHDLGKYTPGFQARLRGSTARFEHATAGARLIGDLVAAVPDKIIAELIAHAIAGHHAGLPDRIGDAASLEARLARFDPAALDPSWRQELAPDGLAGLVPAFARRSRWYFGFRLALVGRMIFSCLVDADYRDTEQFYDGIEGRRTDRDWPALGDLLPQFVTRFDTHMESKPRDGPVNRLRGEILAHVRSQAGASPGLFTLTVPTGGGKTLASLGFALDHARLHGLDRIIYAIPYTSVVEQTADEIRRVLGADALLEHHSAFDEDETAGSDEIGRAGRDKLMLAREDWAAPLIVTTTVQLFESLFAARPSRCRKLHAIPRSVIVLDEAQILPRPLMAPIVRAIHELAASYGCTVLLCTATQPALDARNFPAPRPGGEPHPLALPLAGRELAPDPDGLATRLRRVRLAFVGPLTDDDLVAALTAAPQGLMIVNSRAHALELYRRAVAAGLDGVVHLTTRQHAIDRRAILARVREDLKRGRPCRLVATSLVEAGVDLDFPAVWRAEAGLDQIAQAAGRCNREGLRPPEASLVTVFKAVDHRTPREIEGLVGDLGRMSARHDDLLSPAAMADYFGEMFWRLDAGLDGKRILDCFRIDATGTRFAYRTAGERFRMIESGLLPVIVPADEAARAAIADMALAAVPSGSIARRLQGYLVQVPPKARALLMSAGHVELKEEGQRGAQFAVLATPALYRPEVGLLWENPDYLENENTII